MGDIKLFLVVIAKLVDKKIVFQMKILISRYRNEIGSRSEERETSDHHHKERKRHPL